MLSSAGSPLRALVPPFLERDEREGEERGGDDARAKGRVQGLLEGGERHG